MVPKNVINIHMLIFLNYLPFVQVVSEKKVNPVYYILVSFLLPMKDKISEKKASRVISESLTFKKLLKAVSFCNFTRAILALLQL